ncbi:NAD(P)-dependent oxidoreductase [Ramlibacter sp.]|uniref:NAD(P)-dependent oxidoreductase n=1 Tax=Ramlibacter sp. TaxID=1917967 RepID=UPI003D0D9FF8
MAATRCGFVGLGNMGLPMAGRLLDAGHELWIHDVRPEPLAALRSRGAHAAAGVADIAARCEIVITCLLTVDSISEVLLGEAGLAGGSTRIVVNTSTIGRGAVLRLAQALESRGIQLVDCPISGGPPGARAGKLSVMVSGADAALSAVRPLIDCWGKVTVAGNAPGMAQALKLTNNILSAVAMVASAEAYVMGGKAGLDPEVMTAAINAGSGRNSMTLDKIPLAVLDRSFAFGAPITTLVKDVELALEQGEALGVPMRLCRMAHAILLDMLEAGMGDADITEVVRFVERSAGFELPRTRSAL